MFEYGLDRLVNNPAFTSISSASLKIYGSLKLVPGMTINSVPFTGLGFVFESTTLAKRSQLEARRYHK
jgi:hypothetical protein